MEVKDSTQSFPSTSDLLENTEQTRINAFGSTIEDAISIAIDYEPDFGEPPSIHATESIKPKKADDFIMPEVTQFRFGDTLKKSLTSQTWTGVITKINNDGTIESRLRESEGGTDEIGTFHISEFSPEDRPLLQVGSIFYLGVFEYLETGQLGKQKFLRARRDAIQWNAQDLDRISDRSNDLFKRLFEE
jgi:hypothetical protein